MRTSKLFVALAILLLAWNNLKAQKSAYYTLAEQAQLDRIKQAYLDKGTPEEWASRRVQSIFEDQRKVKTRTSAYGPTPVPGSIWLDRDSVTGAPNASHAHSFTPEEFVKDIFVKGGREVADQAIRNVTLISSTWQGSITDTWNNKGITGPFGGNAGTWASNDRELLYFDHGDTTTMVDTWDGMGQVKYFGIDKGFLLSTGPALKAEGNNNMMGTLHRGFKNWNIIGGGTPPPVNERDPDLSAIAAPLNIETLTSLEFDFKSFTDSVTFQFIFASEEFKEYSNESVNDVFGFFVSGPGLTDEWGNSGDTINIARYPDSTPISVNASNWGYRTTNSFSAYDPFGSTPVKLTPHYPGIGGSTDRSQNAIRPEYHVPVYDDVNEWLMEYNGHSIVLTAKAKLQKGVWYHMKLAIGNVDDDAWGSGVFLKAGSLDLGVPESNIPRPYVQTPYDSIYGWNSLYASCLNTIELSLDSSVSDQDIYVWSTGSGADFVFDTDSNMYFKDSIKYVLPANDSTMTIKFKVDDQVKNGSQVRFYSMLLGGKKDTTETFDLYAKSKTELQNFSLPTTNYAGKLEILSTNGSPYIQRSLNGGLTWEFARDPTTGKLKPFTKTQIANLAEQKNAFIIFREPNTCCTFDTIFIGSSVDPPVIQRTVLMPVISGAICDKIPGEYTVNSRDDFTFTITPTGNNVGLDLKVTTSRTLTPDSEGVIIKKNADGSYTVTIKQVQEPIQIYIDFATSNDTIAINKIWTNGNKLYIQKGNSELAQIYTISGSLVRSVNLNGEIETVELAKGFYIIKTDEYAQKVIIK